MAVVQAGFMASIVNYPKSFGVICTTEELEDYVYFWRCIGYLLGIDDHFNVCSEGLVRTRAITKSIETDIMLKGLHNPPPDFYRMADALVGGMNLPFAWSLIRPHSKESVISFSLDVMGQPWPGWLRRGWMDYPRICLYKTNTFFMRWCPSYERRLNWLLSILVNKSLPLVNNQHRLGRATLNSYGV
jgi:hypothetical protein